MSNLTVKGLFEREDVKGKLRDMLGSKSTGFISSVLQVTSNNKLLANAEPMSIYNAAMMAAALDLPINQNLGFAWIVPYKGQAQFQMGAKGYVQLAQRTGQYQRINVTNVYENQFKGFNALTEELDCDFSVQGNGKVVGYAAYFRLNNGFEKVVYWSKEQVEAHGKRFSQSFNQSFSPWKSDFDAMAQKTVLKNTLSKWGILSIEMQKANIADQAVINDYETEDVEYIDNDELAVSLPTIEDAELETLIKDGYTIEQVQKQYSLTETQILNHGA